MKKFFSAWIFAAAFSTAVCTAKAQTTYSAIQNIENYGWLDQRDQRIIDIVGTNGCNPTSWVNLMVKLQNQYPDVFQTRLVGGTYDEWIQSAINLSGPSYLNTTPAAGTDSGIITSGITSYFRSKGFSDLSVTKYSFPLLLDLYQSALASATIQLLLYPLPGSSNTIGHAVSFGGFNWTDQNNLGYVSENQNATISFVDPQDPLHGSDLSSGAGFATAHAWDGYDGVNRFSIVQYASNDFYIHSAFVVVPELNTFDFFILGSILFLLVIKKTRSRQHCSS